MQKDELLFKRNICTAAPTLTSLMTTKVISLQNLENEDKQNSYNGSSLHDSICLRVSPRKLQQLLRHSPRKSTIPPKEVEKLKKFNYVPENTGLTEKVNDERCCGDKLQKDEDARSTAHFASRKSIQVQDIKSSYEKSGKLENSTQYCPPKENQYTIGDQATIPMSTEKLEFLWQPTIKSNKEVGSNIEAEVTVEISAAKLLLFGGIDPYYPYTYDCLHREMTNDVNVYGKFVLSYDFSKNEWTSLSNMPGSRHHHSATFCNGKIYVIGGTRPALENQKSVISKSVWSFNPKNLEWQNEMSLPFPRRDFALVSIEEVDKKGFFVIGGEDGERNALTSTLFFNVETERWQQESSLNIARSGLMAIAITANSNDDNIAQNSKKNGNISRKKLWAAGGITDIPNSDITNIIEEYDINLNKWTNIGQLRVPRCFGKFCIVNHKDLYLIGGLSHLNDNMISLKTIEKYDSKIRKWSIVEEMSIGRHGHDVLSNDEFIFVIGGVSTVGPTSFCLVECLDTKTMKWNTKIPSLPFPLSGFAAVKVE